MQTTIDRLKLNGLEGYSLVAASGTVSVAATLVTIGRERLSRTLTVTTTEKGLYELVEAGGGWDPRVAYVEITPAADVTLSNRGRFGNGLRAVDVPAIMLLTGLAQYYLHAGHPEVIQQRDRLVERTGTMQRLDEIGTTADGTAAISSGTPVRALGSTSGNRRRAGLNVKNHSTSAPIRVRFTMTDVAPTITSTSCDAVIQPDSDRFFAVGGGIRVWLISASASATAAFTATELLP